MAQTQEVNTKVSMRNITDKGVIKFQEKYDWSGSVYGDYPHQVTINHMTDFLHQGLPPKDNGSMGGVIYVGPNVQGGPDKCAWVLAWSVPGDGKSSNSVYVECGDVSRYPKGTFNWNSIKDKVIAAGSKSESHDIGGTNAAISASIDSDGNNPNVHVVFDVEN